MDRKKAIALSFSVPVAWGFSYPLMKIGMDSMNATSIVALRCIIAFAACVLLFHKHAVRIQPRRDGSFRHHRRHHGNRAHLHVLGLQPHLGLHRRLFCRA